jgi:hypothetical protein
MAYLLWAWKRESIKTLRRYLVVLVTAGFLLVGFAVASGFSSQVSAAIGNEVLLSGQGCGVQNITEQRRSNIEDPVAMSTVFRPFIAQNLETWATYAQQCYIRDTDLDRSKLGACGKFVQSRLPTTIQRNASCPFNATICKSQDRNLIIDTGYLNSHEHFGINAPPHQRFEYRRVVHCAPLETKGYTFRFNLSSDRSYTRYYYGPIWSPSKDRNFTYEYSNDATFELNYVGTQGYKYDYHIG